MIDGGQFFKSIIAEVDRRRNARAKPSWRFGARAAIVARLFHFIRNFPEVGSQRQSAVAAESNRRRLIDANVTMAICLAAVVSVSALLALGDNVDQLASRRETALALNGMQGRMQEIADQVTANTNWDDAVDHASNHFDAAWIAENIGYYYTQPRRFQWVYLLDGANRPVFGMDSCKTVDLSRFAGLAATVAPLVASVRSQELRRGLIKGRSADRRVISSPIQADDLVSLGGHPFILTATLIQPEFGSVLPSGPRASIVVTGEPIDSAFVASLGRRLLLNDAHLAAPSAPAIAHIDLTDRHGARIARIAWSPQHPGADLISAALLPILLGVGAPLVLYLGGRRTARRLRATLVELAGARDEAHAANEQKSEFLATMSHEIRTPLNGVLAMAQLMEQDPLPAAQHERLSVLSQSSQALLTIVNDVLDLSKIEAGKLELDIRPFDAAALTHALEALYAPIANEKGLGLQVELSPGVAGVWRGDPDRLRQVVTNLLSNALKFTQQGEIRLCVAAVAQDRLRFQVRDTGIGVAADKLEVIFDKFRQAECSTSRRFGGTGLGLAISRQLVEMMGGRIWVESREGVGSTFLFEIPAPRIATVTPGPTLRADGGPDWREPIRILAADDNPTNRQVLGSIMDSLGFGLVLCADGESVVEAWRSGQFDLILMDIQMPVLDGVAATRRIRAEEARAGRPPTPIIALTANAMTHQLEQYREAGMDGCVAKPIRIPTLHAAILRALDDGAPDAIEPATFASGLS